jgi:Protein of unknown function (DUF3040)
VPLSEEEQRMLEQLEQALAAEDPKFASTLRGSSARARHRRVAFLSAGVFVLGIVLLMTGVIMPQTIVSVAGFGFMLGGAYFGLTAWRRSTQPEPLYAVGSDKPKSRSKPASKARARSAASGSFMERLEERWRRRRESGF